MIKEYLKLLMTREGKEVLGKRCSNLWLLTLVLTATFASIAFSHGSMVYLRDKMEDPFTNWVSISKATDNERFNKFRDALGEEENRERFDYRGVQMDQYSDYTIMGTGESHIRYMSARFFEHINTPLVKAILDESNVVEGCMVDSAILDDETLGFIITLDAAKRLGYSEDHLPTYIQYLAAQDNEKADSLGLKLVMDDFYPVSIPVLAVVRRLPNNVEMMSANFFYEQQHLNDHTHPFSFSSHPEYQDQLHYYAEEGIEKEALETLAKTALPDSLKDKVSVLPNDNLNAMKPWRPGQIFTFGLQNVTAPRAFFEAIAQAIESKYNTEQVRRVYQLETEDHPSVRSEFISVEFKSLNHIREFEAFAKDYGIQLEMSQVASKENFNAVTVMASVLSTAMVLFSIVCIIMFLVNMLQSYFQKVKHNIGTFKAFGMNAGELIYVYTLILIMIVCSAVIMALLITWMVQLLLPLLGIEKDGFNYLSLWNPMTYIAAAVVIISTVATVSIVMTRMLSQTPGDLIYDRN